MQEEYVRTIELFIYAKENNIGLERCDMYTLLVAGLQRTRCESYWCLSERVLKNFLKIEDLSEDLKSKAQLFLDVLVEFKNDKSRLKKRKKEERVLKKMRKYFKKLKKKGVKNERVSI
ncbi:hypothetical protein [Sulfurimonas denitrificans]|uniref:hypothetical protein n=1 Tax=Sulfurimonas denitrificans TaxID=39766 RepID=UPI00059FB997|nr:hypothetical protein [Sulfurimonas denitrificans]